MESLSDPEFRRQPNDNIFIIDNVITDELCDKIIEQINIGDTVSEDWSVKFNNVICDGMSVTQIKDEKVRKEIDDAIFKVINTSVKVLRLFEINCSGDTGYTLRKITGPTRMHMDGIDPYPGSKSTDNSFRVASIIIALNGDYEGGEFNFPQQKRKIKLKKGQLICFPPYWTHPHGTNPLINGTVRYTINTWLINQS